MFDCANKLKSYNCRMTPEQSAEKVLANPSRIHTEGRKSLAKRRLGERLKHMVKSGALSAVLLAQVVQIAQAGPLIEHMVQSPQSSPVATQAIQATEVSSFSVEIVNPMESVDIPGLVSESGISGAAAITQWRDSGIGNVQVFQLTQLMIMGQSPTLVASEQAKQNALEIAKRTEGIFSVRSQEEAIEFLSENALGLLENEGLFIPGTELMNHQDLIKDNTVIDYWRSYGTISQGDPPLLKASAHESATEFFESVEALKEVVAASGLNSLRVPLPMWTSPAQLKEVADKLSEANNDMQILTGWEGQVLGLKGNVDLTIGSPTEMAFVGVNPSGNVEVLANFELLLHEVLGHGPSLLIARQAGYTPGEEGGAPLFSRALMYQADNIPESHAHLAKSWSELKDGVSEAMDGWEAKLRDHPTVASGELSLEYFSTPWEQIAYSLEGVALEKLGPNSVLTSQGPTPRNFFPSQNESQAAEPVWEQAFDTLNQSWWSKMPEAHIRVDQSAVLAELAREEPAPALPKEQVSPIQTEVTVPSMSTWRQSRAAEVPQVAASQIPGMGR